MRYAKRAAHGRDPQNHELCFWNEEKESAPPTDHRVGWPHHCAYVEASQLRVDPHHPCCFTSMIRHWSVVLLLKSEGTCSSVNANSLLSSPLPTS